MLDHALPQLAVRRAAPGGPCPARLHRQLGAGPVPWPLSSPHPPVYTPERGWCRPFRDHADTLVGWSTGASLLNGTGGFLNPSQGLLPGMGREDRLAKPTNQDPCPTNSKLPAPGISSACKQDTFMPRCVCWIACGAQCVRGPAWSRRFGGHSLVFESSVAPCAMYPRRVGSEQWYCRELEGVTRKNWCGHVYCLRMGGVSSSAGIAAHCGVLVTSLGPAAGLDESGHEQATAGNPQPPVPVMQPLLSAPTAWHFTCGCMVEATGTQRACCLIAHPRSRTRPARHTGGN